MCVCVGAVKSNIAVNAIRKIQQAGEQQAPEEELISWLATLPDNCMNGQDASTHTLLTMAAAQGLTSTFDYLVSRKARTDHRQKNGWNVLSSAIFCGHYELACHIRATTSLTIDSGLRQQFARQSETERLRFYLDIHP